MSPIVESCSLTKMNGGLSRLRSADEDAVSWLTSYGSRNAHEKKKLLLNTNMKPYLRNSITFLQPPPPSMTWDLRILETHFLNPGAFHLVNTLRLSQVPDNTDHWTLFTAYDHIMPLVRGVNEARFDPGSLFRFPYHCEMGHFTTV